MKVKIFLLICFFAVKISIARHNENAGDTVNSSFSMGLRSHYSYIFLHAKDMLPIEDYFPWGVELNFNWQLIGKKTWEQCNCYPRTGLILSFFHFDEPEILGYGYTAAYYIEPFFSAHRKINLSLRGAAGISYLTHPYDSLDNPENLSYSMPVSGYLLLNLGINFRQNKFLNWNFSFNINHISNGGLKEPNKGLNYPSLSLSVDYTFKPVNFQRRERSGFARQDVKKLRKEIFVFTSSRSVAHGEKTRYWIYGVAGNASRRIGRVHALNAGAEWLIDFALKEKLERNGFSDRDYKRAGILLGHEFLMGRFIFSQQLGIYIYNPAQFSDFNFSFEDPVYQRYGLSYRIGKYFLTGINIKVHRQVANFLDVRAGIIF